MGRVVLVTGISRDIGRRFARAAAGDPSIDRVIGVDVIPPRGDIGDVSFVRADIRNPVIAKVLAKEDVDTVVHMSVIATPGSAGGRGTMKELNVIGSMQLLAACQKSTTVRPARGEVDDDGLRLEPARPGDVHRGHGAQAAAVLGLRQGRLRDRGLRPRLRAPTSRRRRDDDPRGQRDRAPRLEPADQLLPAPGHPARAGVRPAPAVPPRGRPDAGAQPRGHARGAGHLQRRGRRAADPRPGRTPSRHAVGRDAPVRRRPPRRDDAPGPPVGLLARAAGVPHLRSWCGHHPDAHRARLRAVVHDCRGVRRLLPVGDARARAGASRAGAGRG